MAYSFAQLEGLWEQAGGSKTLAPVMAAIALAESSGNPGAVNPNDNNGTQTSWGLWQISNGTHSQPVPNILNPMVNARQAVAKYHSSGLGAWGTYTSGVYKNFLGSAAPIHLTAAEINAGATSASGGGGGSGGWLSFVEQTLKQTAADVFLGSQNAPVAPAAAAGLSGLGGIAEALAGLTLPFVKLAQFIDWFVVPSHRIRLAAGVGGGVLVVLGLNSFRHIGSGPSSLTVGGVATPVPEASGSMALALGIGEVGVGAVLLFIAFHNLDPKITTVGGVLADLQQKAQTGLAATTSPAAADVAAAAAPGGGG